MAQFNHRVTVSETLRCHQEQVSKLFLLWSSAPSQPSPDLSLKANSGFNSGKLQVHEFMSTGQ